MEPLDTKELYKKITDVFGEVSQIVVGQERLVNRLLIGLFTEGHILLEGVPGLAKPIDQHITTHATLCCRCQGHRNRLAGTVDSENIGFEMNFL